MAKKQKPPRKAETYRAARRNAARRDKAMWRDCERMSGATRELMPAREFYRRTRYGARAFKKAA